MMIEYVDDRICECRNVLMRWMSDYNFWRAHIGNGQAVGNSHLFSSTNYLQVINHSLAGIGVDSLLTINILLI